MSVVEVQEKSKPYVRVAPAPVWTGDLVERLKKLWSDGESGSIISRKLNDEFNTNFTRNAVIGRAFRMNLPKKGRSPSDNASAQHLKRRLTLKRGRPAVERPTVTAPLKDDEIPLEQRKQLLDLKRRDCRWPVGDPGTPGFFFCGGVSLLDSPYCAAHHKRAHGYVREPMTNKNYKTMAVKVFGPGVFPSDEILRPELPSAA